MKYRWLLSSTLIVALLAASGSAQIASHVALPADLQGELNGVPYRIVVPSNWNGTLLVYAHGYGEGRPVPMLGPTDSDVNALLAEGYALAAARFAGTVTMPGMADPGGFVVKEGMQNSVALTAAFHDMVGRPLRTVMWGRSMGGQITLGLIEKFPGLYDGAVALCTAAAGTPRRFDQTLDIALAYSVAFDYWNPQWGTPGDIRDDLNMVTEVLPHIQQQLTPAKKGQWEFIRLVNRIPIDSYYGPANARLMTLYFAFAVRAELEQRAGGVVAENSGRTYTLSASEKAYLSGLGVNADALLEKMNSNTNFASDRNARNYVEHYVNPSGRINRPVLTLHTTGDPLATPNHEAAYRVTVEQQGASDLLVQQFTNGAGHCTFTTPQVVAGIAAMQSWLTSGNRPDITFFPSTLGFDHNYIPEPWPW